MTTRGDRESQTAGDDRCTGQRSGQTMILSADEFIRRFLLHVLPDGFQPIRYYGFLGNRYRKQKLEQCRRLLGMLPPEPAMPAEKDYRDRYEELTGDSLHQVPAVQTRPHARD